MRLSSFYVVSAVVALAACSPKDKDTGAVVTTAGASGAAQGGAAQGGAAATGAAGSIGTGVGGTGPRAGTGAGTGGPAAGSGGLAGRPATGGTGAAVGGTGGSGGAGGAGGAGEATAGTGGVTPGGTKAVPTVTFDKNVRLNDDTGMARQSEVALAAGPDGTVLAGWMDERGERVCAYSFSLDGGKTWSKNVSIKNTAAFTGDPSVAIDAKGTMYAVCQQYQNSNGSAGNIKMMTSSDKGATWSAVMMIQSAPDKPWIGGSIKDGGTIWVSWLGNPGGIKRSTDGGKTWGPIQSTGRIIHGTAIAPSNTGLLHVPYNLDSNRNQLRYLRSKDDGVTWDQPKDLLPDMGTFCFQCSPRQHPIVGAATDPTGKFVAITWASKMPGGEGDDDVWLLYSKDGGDTWTKPIRVNDNKTPSRQFESWVAVDRYGRVHVAWTDFRDNGQNETWYARSADPEKGFEPNVQVTDGRGSGKTDFLGDYKGIVVQGDDVYVVWQDTRRDGGDIFFARGVGAAGTP